MVSFYLQKIESKKNKKKLKKNFEKKILKVVVVKILKL